MLLDSRRVQQPAQDLSIDSTVSRTQYQFVLESPNPDDFDVWVPRLVGPRRVEIYQRGQPVRTAGPGELLVAPGILANPVPVDALFDREQAERATLTNLLQRQGYAGLDAVRAEGRLEATRAALRRVLRRRGLSLGAADDARVDACPDLAILERWLDEAVVAASAPVILS